MVPAAAIFRDPMQDVAYIALFCNPFFLFYYNFIITFSLSDETTSTIGVLPNIFLALRSSRHSVFICGAENGISLMRDKIAAAMGLSTSPLGNGMNILCPSAFILIVINTSAPAFITVKRRQNFIYHVAAYSITISMSSPSVE
jgi:hypothetical protein